MVLLAGGDPTGRFSSLNDSRLLPIIPQLVEEQRKGKPVLVAPKPPIQVQPADEPVVRKAALFQLYMAHKWAKDYLDDLDVPMLGFFQPWIVTRNPHVKGDFPRSIPGEQRAAYIRPWIAKDIVDVADASTGSKVKVFTDDVHTNEAANPIIAKPMWKALSPLVDEVGPKRRGRADAPDTLTPRVSWDLVRYSVATGRILLLVVVIVVAVIAAVTTSVTVVAPVALYPFL